MDDKAVEGFMGMDGVRYWAISGRPPLQPHSRRSNQWRVKYCLTERAANI
jgi:hypothetical protein